MVSVVVTCYNSQAFLSEALDSLLKQTLSDFEIICVDDGSTNDTWQRLCAYRDKHPDKFKTFHRENGGSPSSAKNYGVDLCSGEYVFLLDHDDYLTPETLEKCYDRALETQADAVLPDTITFDADTGNIISERCGINGDRSVILSNREAVSLSLDWRIHGMGLWKTELVRKFKHDETTMNGDEYSNREFFFHCNKVVFSCGVYMYRYHEMSITHCFSSQSFDPVRTGFKLFAFLKKNDFPASDLARQQFLMYTTLRYSWFLYCTNKNKISTEEKLKISTEFNAAYAALDRRLIWKHLRAHPRGVKTLIDGFGLLGMWTMKGVCWLYFFKRGK